MMNVAFNSVQNKPQVSFSSALSSTARKLVEREGLAIITSATTTGSALGFLANPIISGFGADVGSIMLIAASSASGKMAIKLQKGFIKLVDRFNHIPIEDKAGLENLLSRFSQYHKYVEEKTPGFFKKIGIGWRKVAIDNTINRYIK